MVSTATHGLQALNRENKAEPDLILSDCVMPKMCSIKFIRQARLIPELASISIILMSGVPELHDFSDSLHTLFLKKAVLFDEMLHQINELLQEHVH